MKPGTWPLLHGHKQALRLDLPLCNCRPQIGNSHPIFKYFHGIVVGLPSHNAPQPQPTCQAIAGQFMACECSSELAPRDLKVSWASAMVEPSGTV